MAELDFSALNKLAYRGFETEAERKDKDALIERGFTIDEADKDNPFLQASTASQTATEPPQASALRKSTSASQQAVKRKIEAFTNASGARDYNALYRAAHDYHKRHNPPMVDREYWKTHTANIDDTPQSELDYWDAVTDDLTATMTAHKGDLFLQALLIAVMDELDREYKALRG